MADDGSRKMKLVAAVIGVDGAIGAAVVPFYLNRPPARPATEVAKAAESPAPGIAEAPAARVTDL